MCKVCVKMAYEAKKVFSRNLKTLDQCGAPGAIRTRGLRIRSPLLYPAELRAQQERLLTNPGVFGKIKIG